MTSDLPVHDIPTLDAEGAGRPEFLGSEPCFWSLLVPLLTEDCSSLFFLSRKASFPKQGDCPLPPAWSPACLHVTPQATANARPG